MPSTRFIAGFAGSTTWSPWSPLSRRDDRLLATVEGYRDANPEAVARVVATGEEVATAFLALELDRFGIPRRCSIQPDSADRETDSNDTER